MHLKIIVAISFTLLNHFYKTKFLMKHKFKFLVLSFNVLHCISLSTVVLNSRDRQGMYGMQHFRVLINKPHNSL